ncbi:MAG: transketolase [Leptospiraceae bacterium]|nr:transketolase [Leptospiraceae bacterium]
MTKQNVKDTISFLQEKALWVRIQTFLIHRRAIETRVASSLSNVEIFTTLYYGNILKFNPKNPSDDTRDRFIISKGHGSVSMYPILADLGFFPMAELENVCKEGSFLGGIPDPIIPGYETVNGSLGHGLGVACGVAVGLKVKKKPQKVYVMLGDGELNEGANWEAMMFADHHKLDNLTIIIDNNKVSMLDYSKNILDLESLIRKLEAFNFHVVSIDGHNLEELYNTLTTLQSPKTKVIIANTIKGKGAPIQLETNPLSHITSLKPNEIDAIIENLK